MKRLTALQGVRRAAGNILQYLRIGVGCDEINMSKELNADMIIGCIDMPSGVPKRMPTCRTYLKDRPRSLNQRQLAKVNRHPEVVLARRVRDRTAKSIRTRHVTISRSKGAVAHEEYRQAHRAYLRSKRDARKSMIKYVRAKYGERHCGGYFAAA